MDLFEQLKQLATELDQVGLFEQANLVDNYMVKFAQFAPAQLPSEQSKPVENVAPVASPSPSPTSLPSSPQPSSEEIKKLALEKVVRTTFLMYQELRDFYHQNLRKFQYFGEDNIKIIQTALDQLLTLFRVVIRSYPQDYDKAALGDYEAHLKQLEREIDRSAKMKITPVKVKVDKFLIFDELEILISKIERQHDQGCKELQPILRKIRAIRDAFVNIIQQTSEQIAHADLIETH